MENNAALFTEQRRRLADQLPPLSAAILVSNDVYPTNADGTMHFYQNANLYYLSGIRQEDTALLLFPHHPDEAFREVLFIKEVDELFVKWNGYRLSREEASAISGIKTVVFRNDFDRILKQALPLCQNICLSTDEHLRSEKVNETAEDRLVKKLRSLYPLHKYERLFPLLARQRTVKLEGEIAFLQKACDITEAGFRRLLRFVKPGIIEKQAEAELIHEYMQYGAGFAYEPILASGKDTCILHYHDNNKVCREGDLLLADAAASWQYYNADLTRTIPVSGRFTPRQKQCYNAVLKVQRRMKKEIKAGMLMKDLQAICSDLLLEQLCELGLCTPDEIRSKGKKQFLNRYCYHNFSHFLGLDVHDVAYFHEPLPAGAVLTNEPGIYIWEEGIGIRLENNVLVQENGVLDLMESIPIEAEEIEELMSSPKP